MFIYQTTINTHHVHVADTRAHAYMYEHVQYIYNIMMPHYPTGNTNTYTSKPAM